MGYTVSLVILPDAERVVPCGNQSLKESVCGKKFCIRASAPFLPALRPCSLDRASPKFRWGCCWDGSSEEGLGGLAAAAAAAAAALVADDSNADAGAGASAFGCNNTKPSITEPSDGAHESTM